MSKAFRDRIRFDLMLTLLGGGLWLLSRLNREFQEELKDRSGVAEIRTEDRSVARRFYISNGRLRTARGSHPSPDYAMVYSNATEAVEALSKGSQEAVMQAISDGKLRFEGDMAFGMWFNELLQKGGEMLKQPTKIIFR